MRPVVVFTPPQFREYRRRRRDRKLTVGLLAALVIAVAVGLNAHSTARPGHRERISPACATAALPMPLHATPAAPSPTARPVTPASRARRSATCDRTAANHPAQSRDR